VFIPPQLSTGGRAQRVLYMLDGQYAFSADSNGTNFAADRRVARLIETGTIAPALVVAVDNLEGDRFLQYMPQAIYARAGRGVQETVEREMARVGAKNLESESFIRFLVEQLKPAVDRRYPSAPGPLDTAIFGASMAGVMTGAIFIEGAGSFGRAGCMSPNWAIYDQHMIDHPNLPALWATYFARLGPPKGRRLWLDHGTQMMDAGMAPHQKAIAHRLGELGWQRGCNLQTRVYEAGHAFAETAVQMDEMLAWLLA
jgi:predicted alpha/beta superfamily hydrolase